MLLLLTPGFAALFQQIVAVCIKIWYSDSQQAGRAGDRIPLVARFSPPVQIGAGTNPACCTMEAGSTYRG